MPSFSLSALRTLPYALLRPLLFRMDAEGVHERTLALLAKAGSAGSAGASSLAYAWRAPQVQDPVVLAGLHFPNRVGLAAGLDKNAHALAGLAAMGFGFIEAGTVTPQPQPGNAKPRMFRLPEAQALINRLGFNNDGLAAFVAQVQHSGFGWQAGQKTQGRVLLGLNIGKNASTPMENAVDDYLIGLEGVYPHADYVAVNISSPNTANLRDLQSDAALDSLLARLAERREQLASQPKYHSRRVPIFIKIAPDLDAAQVAAVASALQRHGMDGVIATNTTLQRNAQVSALPHGLETGGLSGAPVQAASNRVIAQLRQHLGKSFPIIGVGGILSGSDAVAKIKAGADVVQIYTGLVYRGPALVHEAALAIKNR